MTAYLYHPTKRFVDNLSRIEKSDPEGHRRIMAVIGRVLENPGDADGRLHGPHSGKYKKYVGRRDYRLVYYWCELCKKANRRLKKACDDCERIPGRSVIIFDVFHKGESARLGY